MKRLWKRKWLVVTATVVICLSISAVAWAATDGQTDETAGQAVTASTAAGADGGNSGGDCALLGTQTSGQGPVAELRDKLKERRQDRLERQKALLDSLRDDMTPADQAAYDELIAEIEAEREAVEDARQDLAGTLKDLRDLVDEYLDAGSGAGN